MPLIILVALNVLPSITLRPVWFVAFAATLLAYRFWLELNQYNMPPRWAQWIVQGATGVAVWQHYHSLFGDEAAGTWLTLLTVLKLFELRTHRDYFVTAMLCFMVLMGVLLLDQSLLLSFFLLADVVLIVGFLFALEDEKWQWSQWPRQLRPPLVLFMKVIPLLVLIFILFPRFSTGFGTGKESGGKTGITDKLRPGSIAELTPSDELVFRATFLNGEVPPRNSLYWRGAVLDRSNGLNWDRSSDSDTRRPRFARQTQNEIEIYMEPGSDKFLFSLGNTMALHFPNDSVGRRLAARDGEIYELGQPLQTRERYFLESSAGDIEQIKDLQKYLQLQGEPSKALTEFLKPYRNLPTSEVVRELQENFRKKATATP